MKNIKFVYQNNEFRMIEEEIGIKSEFDVLVEVKAVSINPIDIKVKNRIKEDEVITLGWDASGIIKEVGTSVVGFEIGDEVFYAGDRNREGSNSRYQLVDYRLIAKKPKSLDFGQSAALPLTALTAWEALFERLGVNEDSHGQSILIINGAGGVGSIAIQLAKHADLNVIVSASREESQRWVKEMGADQVINHHEDWPKLEVDYILCLYTPDAYMEKMAEVIKPFGKICCIVDSEKPLDMNILKAKSVIFAWELMFTRSMYQTNDMDQQGKILSKVAMLVDNGVIKSTLNKKISNLSVESLTLAHQMIENDSMIGKVVIEQ